MKPNRFGLYTARLLRDGRFLMLVPLTFGRARIVLARGWMWHWVFGSW